MIVKEKWRLRSQWGPNGSPRSIPCPALCSRKLTPTDDCYWTMPLSGFLPGLLETGTGKPSLGGRGGRGPHPAGVGRPPSPAAAASSCQARSVPLGPLMQSQLLTRDCFPRQLASGNRPPPRWVVLPWNLLCSCLKYPPLSSRTLRDEPLGNGLRGGVHVTANIRTDWRLWRQERGLASIRDSGGQDLWSPLVWIYRFFCFFFFFIFHTNYFMLKN